MNVALGRLPLAHDADRVELRRKVCALARTLGVQPVALARALAAVSDHARAVRGGGVPLSVLAWLEDGRQLVLRLEAPGAVRTVLLPVPPIERPASFWEEQRALFLQPSRAALLADLAEKNRQLEGHRAALERTVAARTAELAIFKYMLDKATTGVYLLDQDGILRYVNECAARCAGYEPSELVGRSVAVLSPGHTEAAWRARWAQVRALPAGEMDAMVMTHRRKDGSTYPIEVLAHAITHEGVTYQLSVGADITERQAAQDRLEEARRAAEAASRTKSAFLANMSHEIRTPMNAILGYTQILARDRSLSPAALRQVETIGRSGDHLLALINDILDMSKIEAGQMKLQAAPFDPASMMGDLEAMIRVRTEAKGLKLAFTREGPPVPALLGDENKIRQILINLLGNAVKFTVHGGIRLRWGAEALDGGRLDLSCAVEDTGPGISAEDLPRLFHSFEQVNTGTLAPHPGGTGLGLSISRSLAQMMGGDITVASAVGEGSTFRFHAVLPASAEKPAAAAPERRATGLAPGQGEARVLIVDDRESNRDVLQGLLEPLGFALRQAEDGARALEAFAAWRPRAILMDMQMPVMDGREAIRRIRALPEGGEVALIAVTASVFDEDRAAILAEGADAFLRKPFREHELLELLEKHAGFRCAYEAEEAAPAAGVAAVRPEALPAPERQALKEAVDELDNAAIRAVAGRLQASDPGAARYLEERAAAYDYEALATLAAATP